MMTTIVAVVLMAPPRLLSFLIIIIKTHFHRVDFIVPPPASTLMSFTYNVHRSTIGQRNVSGFHVLTWGFRLLVLVGVVKRDDGGT